MPAGRPTKLDTPLLAAMKKVIDDNDIYIFTDEDLVTLLNMEMHPKKISLIAFKKWKGGELPKTPSAQAIVEKFLYLIKRALIKEKTNLFKKMEAGIPGEWQKYAWIIERKFSEWNLKSISESSNKNVNENYDMFDKMSEEDIDEYIAKNS